MSRERPDGHRIWDNIDVWRGFISVFFTAAAFAQQITSVDKLPEGFDAFVTNQGNERLPCTVKFTKPRLNLGLRFESTYTVQASLDPYAGAEHRWRILFRVTPVGGEPVYFVDSLPLSPPPNAGFDAVATGTFFTGEGDYNVKWALWDDLGRVCRQDFRLEAHLSGHERNVKAVMPPGAVGDFSWRPASNDSQAAKTRHVTILVNAALPIAHQGQPPDNQWPALLTILSSVLERMPEADVRLIVFNLDQQRELFRKDHFTPSDIAGIVHAADVLSRWTVDSEVLKKPLGGWELIGGLENAEIHTAPPPDTVLFVGLPAASAEKMPDETPRSESAKALRFVYLRYRPPESEINRRQWGQTGDPEHPFIGSGRSMGVIPRSGPRSDADQPDPIEQAVRRMGGKTIAISSADTLSKAISEVEKPVHQTASK